MSRPAKGREVLDKAKQMMAKARTANESCPPRARNTFQRLNCPSLPSTVNLISIYLAWE